MKRFSLIMLLALIATMCFADDVMRKTSDGTYVVNTTTLCKARGFNGFTPVEVYIKKDKVLKVVALKNHETRGYFMQIVENLLPAFVNVTLDKAQKQTTVHIDGCTGATFSTQAVQKNIAAALEYYKKNKK